MKNWEKNVRLVTPYTPGEQPKKRDIIKLNTNENPYPPAPGVQKVLKKFETDRLRLYPDPASSELVDAIASEYGVRSSQVFAGVGSDDVLAMAFMTFLILKNQSCSRTLPIRFMMSGQKYFGFLMRPCH